MIRVVVLYPQKDGNWFNAEYYKQNHIPLAKKLLEPYGLEKFEFDTGLAGMEGPAPYFAIAYLTFPTPGQFQKGFAECGKALTDDMPNYTRDVIVQIGEIVEI
jgi:uncharacterized protein (TIGR02118 family)